MCRVADALAVRLLAVMFATLRNQLSPHTSAANQPANPASYPASDLKLSWLCKLGRYGFSQFKGSLSSSLVSVVITGPIALEHPLEKVQFREVEDVFSFVRMSRTMDQFSEELLSGFD